MISEITVWVKGIVLVVIFAAFLELLLPVGSMQRFVRVIMGLFIMLSILNPIIELLHKHWIPDNITVMGTSARNTADIKRAVDQAIENRETVTVNKYRTDLSRQIRAIVMAIDGVSDAKVDITLESGAQGKLGTISAITVFVRTGETKADQKVEKVNIGPHHDSSQGSMIPAATESKIRKAITELLGISDKNIVINRFH